MYRRSLPVDHGDSEEDRKAARQGKDHAHILSDHLAVHGRHHQRVVATRLQGDRELVRRAKLQRGGDYLGRMHLDEKSPDSFQSVRLLQQASHHDDGTDLHRGNRPRLLHPQENEAHGAGGADHQESGRRHDPGRGQKEPGFAQSLRRERNRSGAGRSAARCGRPFRAIPTLRRAHAPDGRRLELGRARWCSARRRLRGRGGGFGRRHHSHSHDAGPVSRQRGR